MVTGRSGKVSADAVVAARASKAARASLVGIRFSPWGPVVPRCGQFLGSMAIAAQMAWQADGGFSAPAAAQLAAKCSSMTRADERAAMAACERRPAGGRWRWEPACVDASLS